MNNHDAIIIFFILLIIAIQAYIFYSSIKKIRILKHIFPSTRFFTTVKVRIPEELINTITPEEVFSSLKGIQGNDNRIENNSTPALEQATAGIANGKFFYNGVPSKSGVFTFGRNAKATNQKDALYEFKFVDEELASFSLVNNKGLDFSLMSNRNIFITPVCDVITEGENPSVAVHINDGFIKKVDNTSWQVIEKARVKLI